MDSHLRVPDTARVLNHDSPAVTMIAIGDDVPAGQLKSKEKDKVTPILCPTKKGRIDLDALMDILGKMSIMSIMVEGGSTLMGSMIRERLIDKFYIFKAPKILGGDDGIPMASGPGPEMMDGCLGLKDITVKRFGDDVLIRGYPDY